MSEPTSNHEKTIVLVHGAFADASSWQFVIPLLQQEGYKVIAVQNPLTSLADDIATTKRVLDAQTKPFVVVGHSYGGAVMTGAAWGNDNVKALVYIAAFAPAPGEKATDHSENYAPPALLTALVPDSAGFLYVDTDKFHAIFAGDIPEADANVMAVTQKPFFSGVFQETVEGAAWQSIPSWYLVAQDDNVINPEFERFLATRMGAQVVELKSSHVPFISQPQEVVNLIKAAAASF